jgi:D-tyrosyl-tRNA(Tyr) deacylase
MRAIIQRVSRAQVSVDNEVLGAIGPGLVVLLGVGEGDGEVQAHILAQKIANLRIFADADEKMNLSALDANTEMLVISQFTLFADTRKGRRPSFTGAARPEIAEPLVQRFCAELRTLGLRVAEGRFGAMMMVEIHNDGPVTISLDTADYHSA